MEALQPTPAKIIRRFSKLIAKLAEIEAEIVQFTNLPTDTPSLDHLAQHIGTKLAFFRSLLNAEIASHSSVPDDLAEIEERLVKLEAEFCLSNFYTNNVYENDDSENGSVCESCRNNDRELQREAESDVSSVYEDSKMLYDMVVQSRPPEVFSESVISSSDAEFVCKREKTDVGKRRRRWFKTVAVFTTLSAVLTVSLSSYFEKKRHEGFLTPT